jgi:hypothetical protein
VYSFLAAKAHIDIDCDDNIHVRFAVQLRMVGHHPGGCAAETNRHGDFWQKSRSCFDEDYHSKRALWHREAPHDEQRAFARMRGLAGWAARR